MSYTSDTLGLQMNLKLKIQSLSRWAPYFFISKTIQKLHVMNRLNIDASFLESWADT